MVSKQEQVKKEWRTLEQSVSLVDGVTAELVGKTITVKGPKGEISKLMKFPNVYVEVEGNQVKVGTKRFTQRQKKIIFTYIAHLKNMIAGVTEGFEYELKVVFSKFPVTVSLKGNVFEVKNLLGEKVPRTVEVPQDVKVDVKGADIKVSGIDKERVGQVAANLEQSCRITHLDRRVIQDGIFITKKPHKVYSWKW